MKPSDDQNMSFNLKCRSAEEVNLDSAVLYSTRAGMAHPVNLI